MSEPPRCRYCGDHRRIHDGYLRRMIACPVCQGMPAYRAEPDALHDLRPGIAEHALAPVYALHG